MKVTIVNKGYTKFVNDYKVILELREKIAKEFKLPVNDNSFMLNDNSSKLVSDYDKKEFDKWMNDLIKRNGTTKY